MTKLAFQLKIFNFPVPWSPLSDPQVVERSRSKVSLLLFPFSGFSPPHAPRPKHSFLQQPDIANLRLLPPVEVRLFGLIKSY